MAASGPISFRTRSWIVAGALLSLGAHAARAADCPGHPDALGTSRTIVVDPREHPRIGTMQYRETLPLRDHEVVLTFDDGPLPKYSNQVLDILAAECIKATFFIVGRQAQANPAGVRKLVAAGHTIGTHSQNHPLTFQKMPVEKAEQEINDGIASTSAALTDPGALAPFFRIPGLLRAEGVEEYLASRGIQVWSADFPADDWRHISSARVYQLAMQRLEAKGKGILLLHDIQPRTVAALSKILHDLKARGYRIVHVVPATPGRPATPTEPQQWQLRPPSENVPMARWPKIPNFVFASTDTLPAPALSDFDSPDGRLILPEQPSDHSLRVGRSVPLPRTAPWPRPAVALPDNAGAQLPVPAHDVFAIPERAHVALRVAVPLPRRAEHAPTHGMQAPGKLVAAKPARVLAPPANANARGGAKQSQAAQQVGPAAAARRGSSKRPAQTLAARQRVASLKKR
jgi:peptidoglycan/xylan/chitin deacetylase (PgdA/CDA1 family)